MPSTPRMIELERKASTPGEGLSHRERDEWHLLAGHLRGLVRRSNQAMPVFDTGPVETGKCANLFPRVAVNEQQFYDPADYTAANRYLDSPAWKAR